MLSRVHPAQLVGVNAPFEHTIPMSVMMDSDNNMREYEVVSMPSWLERIELEEGLMFSGTPEMDHMDTSVGTHDRNTD